MRKTWVELLEHLIAAGDTSNEAFAVWNDRYMEETGDDSLAELAQANVEGDDALLLNVLL